MKPITRTRHTWVDILFCFVTGAAPTVFGFAGLPATLCYGIAVAYLVFALMTNTPSAPVRIIPFRVHGAVEIVAGIGLLASPWLFGFASSPAAKGYFVGAGIVTFVVFSLTQWREEPKAVGKGTHPA